MASRSYPIWTKVQACIYKSDKSFGAKDTSHQEIFVGTSAKNSHKIAEICTTKREVDNKIIFKFSVNDEIIKEIKFDKKTKKII